MQAEMSDETQCLDDDCTALNLGDILDSVHNMSMGALINAARLAEIIMSSRFNIKVLDGSFFLPKAQQDAYANYMKGHIPGAQFFDIDKCVSPSPYKRMLPSEPVFENYVGALGIDNSTHVIVYDNHPEYAIYSAARVWWMFRVFGHDSVSILENGFRAWQHSGFDIAEGQEKTEPKHFCAFFKPGLVNSFEQVKDNIESHQFQLIDARSTARFNGTATGSDPDTLPGHIPGSVNIPSRNLQGEYKEKDGCMLRHGALKPVEDLRALFLNNDIDMGAPIAATCGSGVTACNIAFAAFLCGKTDVSVYDGSWTEWYTRSTPELRRNCPEGKEK